MRIKFLHLVIFFLLVGIVYRLLLTQNGNFIFNMDNARDMVDIREMVVLGKPRLIGHTAAIEGVFYGPYWYYLSAIPFILSNGNPYAQIILQIILWAVGGYFALKLVQRYGVIAMVTVGTLWVSSNFLVLSSRYAFNPNPALFLTPLLIFLFEKYLQTKRSLFSITSFALAATFLSNEILFAVLLPIIFITATILTGNKKLFRSKSFWFGVMAFVVVMSPHLFFELRHKFFMTSSLVDFLRGGGDGGENFNLLTRFIYMGRKINEILQPTFLNISFIAFGLVALLGIWLFYLVRQKKLFKDSLLTVLLCYILIPIVGFSLIPVNISSWHWVGVIAAMIILSATAISQSFKVGRIAKVLAAVLFLLITFYSTFNIVDYFIKQQTPSKDPAMFVNELNAVDFVYQKAQGKNFKVYTYLPSVIDYPYQYLFWWRGLQKYDYLPQDYAYQPNKPPYIAQKEKLDSGTHPPSSNLVFLIKEPDRGLRHLWENNFKQYPLLASEMVGPLLIETRQDINK